MTGSGRSHPTIVEIRLADEATIRSLLEGARTLGPFEVIEGAAPPEPLLDLALAGLARRTAAIWCAPWLFVCLLYTSPS
ncbi:MAG: hypothetical protein QUU85_05705, partial [Candidatus Eisenbacteria bacterium]|nr:hypothetical protein [Candidatus Eisenbacteria bacterium]